MAKLSKAKVKAAIPNTGGIIKNIASKCEVSRQAMHRFLNKHPELEELRIKERDEVTDMAQNQLIKAVQKGHPWAVKYWLSTQAKDIFSTRTELTGKDGKAIKTKQDVQIFDLGDGTIIKFE